MKSYILLNNHIYIYIYIYIYTVNSCLIRPIRNNKVDETSNYSLIYLHRIKLESINNSELAVIYV